jgi:outer membrane protein OmpA-like peptidoglycan-associated protein
MRIKPFLTAVLAGTLLSPPASALVPFSISAQSVTAASASKLHADIQVNTSCDGATCSGSTIAQSNTTRKLAVLADGTIATTFRAATGIYVATSSNRGSSFSTPVKVTSESQEAEIAASSAGILFVVWSVPPATPGQDATATYKISKSTDKGITWSSAVEIGTAIAGGMGGAMHVAIDGDYIYGVNQSGSTFFRSTDGGATWTSSTLGASRAFSDIHVDPFNGTIYVFTDNPVVRYFKSTDRGATFSAETTTAVSVFFSVGALSISGANSYFYLAGSSTNLERINLNTDTVETKTVENAEGQQTRSLAADACGNIVSGHKSGDDLFFQYSTDAGTTFSTAEKVIEVADRANASINTNNGDVLFLYEKNNNIYLTTYSGVFSGDCYALTLSKSAIEFSAPGDVEEIVITNTSSSALSLSNISISGSAFTVKHNCPASLAPGATCTITITGKIAGSETLSFVAGNITKQVPVKMGAIAAAKPAASGGTDAKVYRKLPSPIGKHTAHTVLSAKAKRTQRLTTQTNSVCLAVQDMIVTIGTGTCSYQIVDKKSGATILRRSVKVNKNYTNTGTQLTSVGPVNFKIASRRMVAGSQAKIQEITAQAATSSRVLLLGYAANLTDSAAFNYRISEYRAATVKSQLRKNGVKSPITLRALGSSNLISTKKSERQQAQNRRVEVLLWP